MGIEKSEIKAAVCTSQAAHFQEALRAEQSEALRIEGEARGYARFAKQIQGVVLGVKKDLDEGTLEVPTDAEGMAKAIMGRLRTIAGLAVHLKDEATARKMECTGRQQALSAVIRTLTTTAESESAKAAALREEPPATPEGPRPTGRHPGPSEAGERKAAAAAAEATKANGKARRRKKKPTEPEAEASG